MPIKTYMTVGDAARVLDLTPAGVRLMVRSNRIPVAAMTQGQPHQAGIVLLDPKDVEAERKRRIRAAQQKADTLQYGG